MPAHLTAMDGGNAEGLQEQSRLTAMDGGNAEGLQEQSRPCAGRRLAKNRVFLPV
jgi:hypothetical protein